MKNSHKSLFAKINIRNASLLLVVFWIISATSLQAESLRQLAKLSLKNDLMQSYKYSDESVTYGSYEAFARYLPQVNTNYNINEYANISLSGGVKKSNGLTVETSMILFDGFKRYNSIMGAFAYNKYSSNNLENQKQSILLELIKAYYGYLSNKEQQIVKAKEIAQLKAQRNRLRKFYKAGVSTKEDVLSIEANLATAKVGLLELQAKGMDTLNYIRYITNVKNPNPSKNSFVYLPSRFKKHPSSYIKALKAEMQSAKYNAQSKISEYFPTINAKYTCTKNKNIYSDSKEKKDSKLLLL